MELVVQVPAYHLEEERSNVVHAVATLDYGPQRIFQQFGEFVCEFRNFRNVAEDDPDVLRSHRCWVR